ncbi:response regulator [Breznakiella homolactica]|uniref:Response regulator n=1 Tax=Breznakiella homolactica TaxID=2798577 RepID=A0A7T7XN24_9SPIR|nr:response regulator [Breznakiella homolactica]QQO09355.1 response regulator [Breznakiella homolactica]
MVKNPQYILLVDDEENILKSLRRELADWATEKGVQILTARSGEEGLEILQKKGNYTQLVISDLKMPRMKGSDFLLKVHEKYPGIISILLTGYSDTQEIIKAVQAGIFSFILKPWDRNYLLREIEKAYEYWDLRRRNSDYMMIMEDELKWAGELQKAMLKPVLPRSEGMEFRLSYHSVPGLYVSGDYYDVIPLSAGKYLIMLGMFPATASGRP